MSEINAAPQMPAATGLIKDATKHKPAETPLAAPPLMADSSSLEIAFIINRF